MKPLRYRSQQVLAAIEAAKPLNPDIGTGLTKEEVEERKKDNLTNRIKKQVTKSYFRIFFDNLFSFFNIILFCIAALMISAGISTISSYLFVVILTANIVIGLISDIRARVLVDRLRLITDPRSKVIRDGHKTEIPVTDVVLSDIVYLNAGDQIPCDLLLVDGSLYVDESLLTGESEPVKKGRGDELLGGSFVKSGHAYAKAIRIGAASYSETLRTSAQTFSRPKSEIKHSTMLIFLVTGIASIVIGVATFLNHYIPIWSGIPSGDTYQDFIQELSGKMVAMIPSGLYLLTSMTLAVGVIALARKRMNVQELYCIEMLARVDTVCFDKTGTLTDGTLSLREALPLGKEKKEDLIHLAYSLVKATGDNNSTALAILEAGKNLKPLDHQETLPFDSSRKYSGASLEGKTYALGAYGFLKAKKNSELEKKIESYAKEGYRVLVLYSCKSGIDEGEIDGLCTPIGLLMFLDTIKPDAKENIAWFVDNGVAIKVISGDDAVTVSSIAREVGVPNASHYISLAGIPVEEVGALIDDYAVFGRVSPEQKAALVEALQKKGHKVAMTGDGVNDILALKKADCSIAMASGSAAARNISHLVALDNDFSHLPDVVGEGRRVINNLQRTASLFLCKTFFAIVLSFVFLISDWCGGESYPFTTQNLLIWEVLSIGVPAFFLSLQPTKERLQGSFLKNILLRAIPGGFCECLVVIVIYLSHAINPAFMNLETARTLSILSFSVISFVTLFRVSLPPNKLRLIIFAVMLVAALGLFGLDAAIGTGALNIGLQELLGIDFPGTTFGVGQIILAAITTLIAASIFIATESYLVARSHAKGAKQ